MRIAVKGINRAQKGAGVLSLVLILLVLGGLILTPMLSFMSTGLMTGQVYEESMHLLYAADAGMEDGLWQIRNEQLPILFPNPPTPPDGYDKYAYSDYDDSYRWDYSLGESINGKNVSVTIENVWIPRDIPAPNATAARQIIETGSLIVAGSTSVAQASTYEIKATTTCGSPTLTRVGVWLPPGFEYVMGSGDLEQAFGEPYYSIPGVFPHQGGYAVVWDFGSPVSISDFPESFAFEYSGPQEQIPGSAVSWVVSDGTNGDYYTWDADVTIYKVTSTATDPDSGRQMTVEGYTSNVEARILGSAISGDYHATGATLMTPDGGPISSSYYRDVLFRESSATVAGSDIPNNANIDAAYLYWSGWIETSPSGLTIFYENCSDFDAPVMDWNWTANSAWEIYGSSSYDQEFRGNAYYAMGEGEWQLLWGPENCQDFIVPDMNWDAESAWDTYYGEFRGNNYYQEPTGEWQLIWGTENCQDFVEPIMNWDAESAWDTYYGEFRGNAYDLGGSSGEWEVIWGPEYCQDFVEPIMNWDAESAWDTYNGEFRGSNYASSGGWQVVWGPENCSDFAAPEMDWIAGSAWDTYYGQFRGNAYGSGGSGGEWQLIFDDDCSDFGNWDNGTAWDLDYYYGRFRGDADYGEPEAGRYVTMNPSINLSSYAGQTVEVSWSQDEDGYLEDDDRLYFAFSADGGSTWSTNYEAFRNDDPPSSFSYTIPNTYLTNNFRMRFYLYGFSGDNERCYVDSIEISAFVEPTSDPRYLAMGSSIDLSAYAGQTVEISWQQDESGYQGYDDCLYFNFSGNGGSTWSNDYLAFCNDDPPSSFSYTVPSQYLTNDFRMRFYLSDFDDYSTQYCYVDNIQISAEIPPSSPESYLTMSSSIDLSTHAAQTVEISWQQDESGSQGYGDCLYFSFSGNGGSTWSTDYLAFCNDDPVGSFSYTIPGQYLTSDFRMRFYLSGFDDYSTQYCYVDNIQISAQTTPSASGRYLTMSSSIDLSDYAGQTIEISWQQDEGGYLESDDCLYFNFSADGGITWSGDYLAFCDDYPVGSFSRTIPNEYLTGDFRMRFYLSGFTSSSEYCYIDNIEISGFVLPPYEPPGSNLTMSSSIPLGAYAGQTVRVSWDQHEAGELESDDCLYFSFSANGGFTWSEDYVAFCNDSPTSSFTYNIPDQYLTDYFKMRFHLSGFTSSSEYCYIDNIEISRFVASLYEPPERSLAMLEDIDLSAYSGQRLDISWEQDEDGDLEDSDRLYFAFSADGGTTWSNNIEAFRNDNPQGNFHYTIPNEYVTNNFRMKFYLEGFEEGGYYGAEYCYIDDIMITAQVPLVETAKVNRVMFGTPYNTQEITAEPDDCQTEPTPDAVQGSWSYSCRYDATDIVINGLDPDTLSGEFVLGHVIEGSGYTLYDPVTGNPSGQETAYPLATPAQSTTTRYQWAYAGWSLVIIYSSPETKGHQLYLFDTFRYVGLDTRVTFSITNFLAPDDTTGSHLTYFVGEGDNHYTTDYIMVNGYQLPLDGDPYEPYPPVNPRNNVFNSYSNSLDDPYLSGVDVDTFDVSACIQPADSTAEVILDNGEEIYNLVYIILSFRSLVTSGGVMGYLIR